MGRCFSFSPLSTAQALRRTSGEGPLPWADGGFCLYCEESSPRIRRVVSEGVPHRVFTYACTPLLKTECLRQKAGWGQSPRLLLLLEGLKEDEEGAPYRCPELQVPENRGCLLSRCNP